MNPGEPFRLVQLNTTDPEYQKVAQAFTPCTTPKSIQRVQNPNLYQIYSMKKKQMDDSNPGAQNEKSLYHGTASDALPNINSTGFNRSYCGKNATAFGDGVYFAVDPSYSARTQYARPDPGTNNRHVYVARVLVGKHCKGQQGLKEPPHINGTSGPRYDSIDCGSSAFVIFYDTQAYPEYLIIF